jgi:hypothetical protein
MGFFNRRSSPPPPPPPPPAPAVQAPTKPTAAQTGGKSSQPSIQTTARGVMSDAPLQYASLLGQTRRRMNGMM